MGGPPSRKKVPKRNRELNLKGRGPPHKGGKNAQKKTPQK